MSIPIVYIITRAERQDDGSFQQVIDGAWVSREAARGQLKVISNNYNNKENVRAKSPIGQVDDLSIELLVDNYYECQSFYSIKEQVLRS